MSRLAPSPTGAQHVGNARTYLLAWLDARKRGGRIILRIEDLDSPRIKPGAAREALDDLRWMGLDWDEGPDRPGSLGPYVQSERLTQYRASFDRLCEQERVYPCTCSRSDVESAASAPHWEQEGPVYGGTCRFRTAGDVATLGEQPFAWRFRATDESRSFVDASAGPQHGQVASMLGDFVIAKRDGIPAYQLAVVVDDHAMGVTDVVRGDDLLPSTFRQLELYAALGWTPPRFAHPPLVVGPDGKRLAKRHGDTRISVLREAQVPPQRLVGLLAWSCGLRERHEPATPAELLADFDWQRIPRAPWMMTPEHWSWLRSR